MSDWWAIPIALGGLLLAFGFALGVGIASIRIADWYRFNRWMARKGPL